jgi:hypothetical protein
VGPYPAAIFGFTALASLLLAATPAMSAALALVLAIDVSASVTADSYLLQHDGIARAFENPHLPPRAEIAASTAPPTSGRPSPARIGLSTSTPTPARAAANAPALNTTVWNGSSAAVPARRRDGRSNSISGPSPREPRGSPFVQKSRFLTGFREPIRSEGYGLHKICPKETRKTAASARRTGCMPPATAFTRLFDSAPGQWQTSCHAIRRPGR